MPTPQITERQFTALMKATGVDSGSKTFTALRAIFIEGKTVTAAAKIAGVTHPVVYNAKCKVLIKYSSIPNRINLLQDAYGTGELLKDTP